MAMADDRYMTLDGPAGHPRSDLEMSDGRCMTFDVLPKTRGPTDRSAGERGPRYVGSMEPHCNTSTFDFLSLCTRSETSWLRAS